MRRRLAGAAVALALAASAAGCGYHDDNLEAARVVAQSYLQGWHDENSYAICRVLGPGQLQMYAGRGGGSCQVGVAAGFGTREPLLHVGAAKELDDGVVQVEVVDRPKEPIVLLHLASTWHVVSGWRLA
jgi:hypothetical protein